MQLDKDFRYWILCEDKQTRTFLHAMLENQGISRRKLFDCPLPAKGCGSQYVIQTYPKELARYRTKKREKVALLVCLDADNYSVLQRKQTLDESCQNGEIPVNARTQDDRVCIFVPKWNIETWIYFLNEMRVVSEEKAYPHIDSREVGREGKRAGERMAELVSGGRVSREPLPSLFDAYHEYRELCEKQRID